MEDKEDIFEIENSIVLEIPKDMKQITEGVRESFYYLNGLINLDSVYRGLNQNESLNIKEKNKIFQEELNNLENDLYFSDKENSLVSFSDNKQLKDLIKSYIVLKEKIDKFQLEILEQINDSSYKTLKNITEKKPYLENYSAQIYSIFLIKSAFLHSHAENKTTTYFLLIQNEEKFDNKVNPYEKYDYITVNDYSYNLYRERIKFESIFEHLFKLIFSIQEIDDKRNLDSLVNKQYNFNKQVVILTYIIAFLTIVMTFASLYPLFFK